MQEKILQLFHTAEKKISNHSIDNLIAYSELLLGWNTKINLISRKNSEHFFEQHLAPSLSYYILNIISDEDTNIIDLGSGGGLPAIVNAILYPRRKFFMLDSTKKKVMALNDIIRKLSLKNCSAVWGRAEEFAFKKAYRKKFDLCTSRGLASLEKLIPYSLPFLKDTGIILALKGGNLNQEIAGIKKRSRYRIIEYEMDIRFHYIDRLSTLKIVEISR